MHPAESEVSTKMVRLYHGQLRRTHDRIRCSRRDILLGFFLCHFLAEEARFDAGAMLQQRANKPQRGDALRFCVPPLLEAYQQAPNRAHH